jgi:hypothetical protein
VAALLPRAVRIDKRNSIPSHLGVQFLPLERRTESDVPPLSLSLHLLLTDEEGQWVLSGFRERRGQHSRTLRPLCSHWSELNWWRQRVLRVRQNLSRWTTLETFFELDKYVANGLHIDA